MLLLFLHLFICLWRACAHACVQMWALVIFFHHVGSGFRDFNSEVRLDGKDLHPVDHLADSREVK